MVQVKREAGSAGYPTQHLAPPPGGNLGPYGAYLGAGPAGGMAGAGAGHPGAGVYMMQPGQMIAQGMMVGQASMIPPHVIQQAQLQQIQHAQMQQAQLHAHSMNPAIAAAQVRAHPPANQLPHHQPQQPPRPSPRPSPATPHQGTGQTAASPQESATEESIDRTSARGMFGWATVDGVNIPYLLRDEKKYVAVRMVELKLLSKYPSTYPEELKTRPPLISHYVTAKEAELLNEINQIHCEGEYGAQPFAAQDLIVKLSDFEAFLGVVKKHFPSPSRAGSGGRTLNGNTVRDSSRGGPSQSQQQQQQQQQQSQHLISAAAVAAAANLPQYASQVTGYPSRQPQHLSRQSSHTAPSLRQPVTHTPNVSRQPAHTPPVQRQPTHTPPIQRQSSSTPQLPRQPSPAVGQPPGYQSRHNIQPPPSQRSALSQNATNMSRTSTAVRSSPPSTASRPPPPLISQVPHTAPAPKEKPDVSGGWVQVNNTVVPYIGKQNLRYVPLSVIRYAAGLLNDVQVGPMTVVPSEEECRYLNDSCQKAGLNFTFAPTTKLVSLRFVEAKANEPVMITDLPKTNPFGAAEYKVLPGETAGSAGTAAPTPMDTSSSPSEMTSPSTHPALSAAMFPPGMPVGPGGVVDPTAAALWMGPHMGVYPNSHQAQAITKWVQAVQQHAMLQKQQQSSSHSKPPSASSSPSLQHSRSSSLTSGSASPSDANSQSSSHPSTQSASRLVNTELNNNTVQTPEPTHTSHKRPSSADLPGIPSQKQMRRSSGDSRDVTPQTKLSERTHSSSSLEEVSSRTSGSASSQTSNAISASIKGLANLTAWKQQAPNRSLNSMIEFLRAKYASPSEPESALNNVMEKSNEKVGETPAEKGDKSPSADISSPPSSKSQSPTAVVTSPHARTSGPSTPVSELSHSINVLLSPSAKVKPAISPVALVKSPYAIPSYQESNPDEAVILPGVPQEIASDQPSNASQDVSPSKANSNVAGLEAGAISEAVDNDRSAMPPPPPLVNERDSNGTVIGRDELESVAMTTDVSEAKSIAEDSSICTSPAVPTSDASERDPSAMEITSESPQVVASQVSQEVPVVESRELIHDSPEISASANAPQESTVGLEGSHVNHDLASGSEIDASNGISKVAGESSVNDVTTGFEESSVPIAPSVPHESTAGRISDVPDDGTVPMSDTLSEQTLVARITETADGSNVQVESSAHEQTPVATLPNVPVSQTLPGPMPIENIPEISGDDSVPLTPTSVQQSLSSGHIPVSEEDSAPIQAPLSEHTSSAEIPQSSDQNSVSVTHASEEPAPVAKISHISEERSVPETASELSQDLAEVSDALAKIQNNETIVAPVQISAFTSPSLQPLPNSVAPAIAESTSEASNQYASQSDAAAVMIEQSGPTPTPECQDTSNETLSVLVQAADRESQVAEGPSESNSVMTTDAIVMETTVEAGNDPIAHTPACLPNIPVSYDSSVVPTLPKSVPLEANSSNVDQSVPNIAVTAQTQPASIEMESKMETSTDVPMEVDTEGVSELESPSTQVSPTIPPPSHDVAEEGPAGTVSEAMQDIISTSSNIPNTVDSAPLDVQISFPAPEKQSVSENNVTPSNGVNTLENFGMDSEPADLPPSLLTANSSELAQNTESPVSDIHTPDAEVPVLASEPSTDIPTPAQSNAKSVEMEPELPLQLSSTTPITESQAMMTLTHKPEDFRDTQIESDNRMLPPLESTVNVNAACDVAVSPADKVAKNEEATLASSSESGKHDSVDKHADSEVPTVTHGIGLDDVPIHDSLSGVDATVAANQSSTSAPQIATAEVAQVESDEQNMMEEASVPAISDADAQETVVNTVSEVTKLIDLQVTCPTPKMSSNSSAFPDSDTTAAASFEPSATLVSDPQSVDGTVKMASIQPDDLSVSAPDDTSVMTGICSSVASATASVSLGGDTDEPMHVSSDLLNSGASTQLESPADPLSTDVQNTEVSSELSAASLNVRGVIHPNERPVDGNSSHVPASMTDIGQESVSQPSDEYSSALPTQLPEANLLEVNQKNGEDGEGAQVCSDVQQNREDKEVTSDKMPALSSAEPTNIPTQCPAEEIGALPPRETLPEIVAEKSSAEIESRESPVINTSPEIVTEKSSTEIGSHESPVLGALPEIVNCESKLMESLPEDSVNPDSQAMDTLPENANRDSLNETSSETVNHESPVVEKSPETVILVPQVMDTVPETPNNGSPLLEISRNDEAVLSACNSDSASTADQQVAVSVSVEESSSSVPQSQPFVPGTSDPELHKDPTSVAAIETDTFQNESSLVAPADVQVPDEHGSEELMKDSVSDIPPTEATPCGQSEISICKDKDDDTAMDMTAESDIGINILPSVNTSSDPVLEPTSAESLVSEEPPEDKDTGSITSPDLDPETIRAEESMDTRNEEPTAMVLDSSPSAMTESSNMDLISVEIDKNTEVEPKIPDSPKPQFTQSTETVLESDKSQLIVDESGSMPFTNPASDEGMQMDAVIDEDVEMADESREESHAASRITCSVNVGTPTPISESGLDTQTTVPEAAGLPQSTPDKEFNHSQSPVDANIVCSRAASENIAPTEAVVNARSEAAITVPVSQSVEASTPVADTASAETISISTSSVQSGVTASAMSFQKPVDVTSSRTVVTHTSAIESSTPSVAMSSSVTPNSSLVFLEDDPVKEVVPTTELVTAASDPKKSSTADVTVSESSIMDVEPSVQDESVAVIAKAGENIPVSEDECHIASEKIPQGVDRVPVEVVASVPVDVISPGSPCSTANKDGLERESVLDSVQQPTAVPTHNPVPISHVEPPQSQTSSTPTENVSETFINSHQTVPSPVQDGKVVDANPGILDSDVTMDSCIPADAGDRQNKMGESVRETVTTAGSVVSLPSDFAQTSTDSTATRSAETDVVDSAGHSQAVVTLAAVPCLTPSLNVTEASAAQLPSQISSTEICSPAESASTLAATHIRAAKSIEQTATSAHTDVSPASEILSAAKSTATGITSPGNVTFSAPICLLTPQSMPLQTTSVAQMPIIVAPVPTVTPDESFNPPQSTATNLPAETPPAPKPIEIAPVVDYPSSSSLSSLSMSSGVASSQAQASGFPHVVQSTASPVPIVVIPEDTIMAPAQHTETQPSALPATFDGMNASLSQPIVAMATQPLAISHRRDVAMEGVETSAPAPVVVMPTGGHGASIGPVRPMIPSVSSLLEPTQNVRSNQGAGVIQRPPQAPVVTIAPQDDDVPMEVEHYPNNTRVASLPVTVAMHHNANRLIPASARPASQYSMATSSHRGEPRVIAPMVSNVAPNTSFGAVTNLPQAGIVSVSIENKVLSCIVRGPSLQKYALLEALSRVFFPYITLKEFRYGIEQVLKVPTASLSPAEERLFIKFYDLPTSSLMCNKVIRLSDFEQHLVQMRYMFRDKESQWERSRASQMVVASPKHVASGDQSGFKPQVGNGPRRPSSSQDDPSLHDNVICID